MNLREDWIAYLMGAFALGLVLLGLAENNALRSVLGFVFLLLIGVILMQRETIRDLQQE